MRLHPARQKTFLPISVRICVTIFSFRFYGYAVMAGIEQLIEYMNNLEFDESDIDDLQDGAEQLADMLQRIQRTAEKAISVPSAAKALVPFL